MIDTIIAVTGSSQWLWTIIVLGFLGLELEALFNKERGDTWSEVTRYIFGFSARQKATGIRRRLRQAAFIGLWLWFGAHIALGW